MNLKKSLGQFSSKELAELLGVSESTAWRKREDINPQNFTLGEIEKIFGFKYEQMAKIIESLLVGFQEVQLTARENLDVMLAEKIENLLNSGSIKNWQGHYQRNTIKFAKKMPKLRL